MVGSSLVTAAARRMGGAGPQRVDVAVLGFVPRRSRCATLSSPPTTGSSTRRSPPTSRTEPPMPPRNTMVRSNLVAAITVSDGGRQCDRALAARRARAGGGRRRTLAGVAVSVEMFAWSERHRESPLAQAFRRPGYEMQRLFATREPTGGSSMSGARRWQRSCAAKRPSRLRNSTRNPGPRGLVWTLDSHPRAGAIKGKMTRMLAAGIYLHGQGPRRGLFDLDALSSSWSCWST